MLWLADYLTHNISPFLIRFGESGWGIRYYGLAYALGFCGLYFGLVWQARRGWLKLSQDAIDSLVMWLALGGVILGGRLGYCLLYDWQQTLREPWSIFQIWRGGMASHGGILGVVLVLWWFSKKYKIPFYQLTDAVALCTPPALAIGRIANFMNGELWGRPAEVSWALYFPQADIATGTHLPRHPSQLYEAALEGLLLWILLLLIRRNADRAGTVSVSFLIGYAVMRFIAEFFREPDPQIGYYYDWMTQGQLFSVGLFALGLWLAARRKRMPPAPLPE